MLHLGKGNSEARPSEGRSKVKGRGLVLQELTRTGAALSLTTAGHRVRQEGPGGEPADIRSPVIHQQTGVAVGPHPCRVRGFALALLQAVGMGNPGWVLWCLSCSLPGTHMHVGTCTETSATCRPGSGWGSSTGALCSGTSHQATSSSPVPDVDGQGTVPGPHSMGCHRFQVLGVI